MAYIDIKNKKETSNKIPPTRYSSWLDFWKRRKGLHVTNCEVRSCIENAEVGGHVTIVGERTGEYILPVCYKHHTTSEDEIFEAWESDLITVK